ncbi:CinA family protein [uncultured Microbacterium sp.]|uniref:CinA family protein n=1 Tax=uncultured Microbacterium sp. TaxID=191216 RepID=UPI00261E6406|nr:nicotinamide-nucleotide amidohydrolase family protein [uncultured Microbacterium sp.]
MSVERLGRLAREHDLRIAVVESLTSGGLAHAVGAGDDAARWFAGGIVAYMTDVKVHLLGVTAGTDPCSAACAAQLAAGGRELFGADICVSTTGIGGPDAENGHRPGTVYLGWGVEGAHGDELLTVDGSPEHVLNVAIEAAIRLLIERAEDFAIRPTMKE